MFSITYLYRLIYNITASRVFTMSAFSTHACFELNTQLIIKTDPPMTMTCCAMLCCAKRLAGADIKYWVEVKIKRPH